MKKIFYSLAIIAGSYASAQVTAGTETYTSSLPISISRNYSYSQTIYPNYSLGKEGKITAIEYQLKDKSVLTNSDEVDVYISHSIKSEFETTKDWHKINEQTKVFSGLIKTINNKVMIDLDQPFEYNGKDHLIVTVHEKKKGYASFSNTFLGTPTGAKTSLFHTSFSDSDVIDPTKLPDGKFHDISPNITFYGLKLENTSPPCNIATVPRDGATNQLFLPKIAYMSSAGATKYFVTVGTNNGGNDIVYHYDNEDYLDFYFTKELSPETTYYVTLNASNKYGEASDCTSTSFTTGKAASNDTCSTAESIATLPFKKSFDGSFATNQGGPVQCDNKGVANDGLWHVIEGDGADITITVTPTGFWNPQIVVKEGSCTATSCLANVDEASYQKPETVTLTSTVEGKKYYVNVGSSSIIDFTEGKYDLEVTTTKKLQTSDVKSKQWKVYPNPVKQLLMIEQLESDKNNIQLFDFQGKEVVNTKYTNKGIDLVHLPKGVYILKISVDGQVKHTQKIIKD